MKAWDVGLRIVYVLVWQDKPQKCWKIKEYVKLLVFSWHWFFEKYEAFFNLHKNEIVLHFEEEKSSLSYIKKNWLRLPFQIYAINDGGPRSRVCARVCKVTFTHLSLNSGQLVQWQRRQTARTKIYVLVAVCQFRNFRMVAACQIWSFRTGFKIPGQWLYAIPWITICS